MDLSKSQSKKTLDKVTGPDVLTADLKKGFVWTVAHTQIVGGVIALLLLIGGGYTLYTWQQESKERELQSQYYDIEIAVSKKRAEFAGEVDPMNPAAKASTVKPSGDLHKDYGTLVTDLASFVDAHPKSVAGALAALNLASLQNEYKDATAALATLQKVQAPAGLVGSLLKMETATLLSNNGNCAEATKMWETLSRDAASAFLKAEAKLKMGLCAESTGDKETARKLYQEVEFEAKDTSSGRAAKQYLRLLSQSANEAAK